MTPEIPEVMEDSHLTQWAHHMLVEMGVETGTADRLDQFVILALILLTAWVADVISRFLILQTGKRIGNKAGKRWKELLFDPQVLRKFSALVPIVLIYLLIPLAFPDNSHTPIVLQKLCLVYIIVVVLIFFNIVLKVTFTILYRRDDQHERPLKGMLQIMQVGLFFIGAIVIVSMLVGRSPLKMLAGLGASAAILMLIFKDSILGLVSGVMLSANKMLRPGDWISMPKYNVDGTVLEVSLNTVKIENFDNTVTTIPPFILTGDSFQNWRWMQESGGRRIMRSVSIDMGSVVFCTPDMIERYKKNPLIREFIEQKEKEYASHTAPGSNSDGADFFRITNLTVLRAYLNLYVQKLSVINHDLTCMVRHLQPTAQGIPIEIYCFSAIKEWVAYEGVQADLFDHVIAVVPEFDLAIYQSQSGSDLTRVQMVGPDPAAAVGQADASAPEQTAS